MTALAVAISALISAISLALLFRPEKKFRHPIKEPHTNVTTELTS